MSRARVLRRITLLLTLAAAAWFEAYVATIVWWHVRAFLPLLLLGAAIAALNVLAQRTPRPALLRNTALALGALLVIGWFVVDPYWQDRAYGC